MDAHVTHGELKRRLARILGSDCSRYADEIGVERHAPLTYEELTLLCEELGLEFLDGTKQQKRDTIMLKLGRDHRTGVSKWDSSDLHAILDRLDEDAA